MLSRSMPDPWMLESEAQAIAAPRGRPIVALQEIGHGSPVERAIAASRGRPIVAAGPRASQASRRPPAPIDLAPSPPREPAEPDQAEGRRYRRRLHPQQDRRRRQKQGQRG